MKKAALVGAALGINEGGSETSPYFDQVQRRSVRESGNWRTRLPVAAKIALQIAGATGGNAGSPRPVVG